MSNDLTPNLKPPATETSFIFQDDLRFPEVHCSTVQAAAGVQYASWFGGRKEGSSDVKVWFSRRKDGKWAAPRMIAGDDSTVHWNPVTFLPDRIRKPEWLIVFYKIGTPIPMWKTYWIESLDGGDSWSDPKELVETDESGGRGPQVWQKLDRKALRKEEEEIQPHGVQKNPPIVLSNGDWLCGASREITLSDASGKWDAFADIAPTSSANQIHKWIRAPYIQLPGGDLRDEDKPGRWPGEGVIQPSAFEDPDQPGKVSMFLRSSNGWIQRTDSSDYGRTWCEAYDSPLPSNNSGQCVTMMRDGRLVCAYNPVGKNWGPRTPLVLSISSNKGMNWKHWITLEDQPPPSGFEKVVALETGIVNDGKSEFSYPTLTPTEEGDVVGVWVSYTWQRRGVVVAKVFDPPAG